MNKSQIEDIFGTSCQEVDYYQEGHIQITSEEGRVTLIRFTSGVSFNDTLLDKFPEIKYLGKKVKIPDLEELGEVKPLKNEFGYGNDFIIYRSKDKFAIMLELNPKSDICTNVIYFLKLGHD